MSDLRTLEGVVDHMEIDHEVELAPPLASVRFLQQIHTGWHANRDDFDHKH